MEALHPRVSFADLQRMPDDGVRYELYDGELYTVPSPLPRHEMVRQRIQEILIDYRRRKGGLVFAAPFDIVLSNFDVVQPDLVYFGPEAARRIEPDEYVRFPPDLAIEVLSPSTKRIDRGRKRRLFAKYHLPELWLVDPAAARVEVCVLAQRSDRTYALPRIVSSGTFESPTQPTLTVSLEELFARPV